MERWYWESIGRNQKYANDIWAATESVERLNSEEAQRRSPLCISYNPELRKNASLHIYAGIHDGYVGSVPIVHSLKMYNKIISNRGCSAEDLIPESTIIDLSTMRTAQDSSDEIVGGRAVHLHQKSQGVEIVLFEGGHEQLDQVALGLVPVNSRVNRSSFNALVLGDSNGARNDGWVHYFQQAYPYANVINASVNGKTVGIDNGGRAELNSLKTIDSVLFTIKKPIQTIIIALGTNDTKTMYADQRALFQSRYQELLDHILDSDLYKQCSPQIILTSIPPIDSEIVDPAKYKNSEDIIPIFNRQIGQIAKKYRLQFIDTYQVLKKQKGYHTIDGVHLTPAYANLFFSCYPIFSAK